MSLMPDSNRAKECSISNFEVFSTKNRKLGSLGVGGFAEVTHCICMDTGKEFVLKRLKQRTGELQQQSLKDEVDVLKTLNYRNIVQYYGCRIKAAKIRIFIELAIGSVRMLIREFGPLNNKLTTAFLKQMLNGIKYLHEKKLIHMDVKAANILKASDGTIKIADYGLAKGWVYHEGRS